MVILLKGDKRKIVLEIRAFGAVLRCVFFVKSSGQKEKAQKSKCFRAAGKRRTPLDQRKNRRNQTK
ncbi:MAG: hypothetical protein KH334_05695, partial [Clostridiales bacterium]|nr:hypothetical protein [Clostridiales bacterium]